MKTESKSLFPNRFDYEGDEEARCFFDEADLRMSPEEYAARYAHSWLLFHLHHCRFRDPVLGAWIRRFGALFENPAEVERYRQQFLTPEEIAEVRRQEAEEF